jgi:hypothetical protein
MDAQRTPELQLSPLEIESVESAMKAIIGGFPWMQTPQGHAYWEQVVNNLAALIGRDPSAY